MYMSSPHRHSVHQKPLHNVQQFLIAALVSAVLVVGCGPTPQADSARNNVSHMPQPAAKAPVAEVTATVPPAPPELSLGDYATSLEIKYGGRIVFSSPQAEQIVRNFVVRCPTQDERYLPLISVLFYRFEQLPDSSQMKTEVYNMGAEVRIQDILPPDPSRGFRGYAEPSMEINKWGELRPLNFRRDALFNQCYATKNRIWIGPIK